MISLVELIKGRPFASDDQIVDSIISRFDDASLKQADEFPLIMIFFKTKKQRSYFVASKEALYCVTDLLERSAPRCLWRIPRKETSEIKINVWSEKQRIGIGDKPPRRYSRMLFIETNIRRRVNAFIRRAFEQD